MNLVEVEKLHEEAIEINLKNYGNIDVVPIDIIDDLIITNTDDISDGSHTFGELYYHRMILFAVVCGKFKELACKSRLHDDGTMFDDYFIVGINTPLGQATYHYEIKFWDSFPVKELDKAPEWDGHSPQEAIERIASLVEC